MKNFRQSYFCRVDPKNINFCECRACCFNNRWWEHCPSYDFCMRNSYSQVAVKA